MIPVLYKEMEACRCGPSGENTFGAARRPLQTWNRKNFPLLCPERSGGHL